MVVVHGGVHVGREDTGVKAAFSTYFHLSMKREGGRSLQWMGTSTELCSNIRSLCCVPMLPITGHYALGWVPYVTCTYNSQHMVLSTGNSRSFTAETSLHGHFHITTPHS